jgi:hypothetical protein
MFLKRCPYRMATGKKCDPNGKRKAHYDKTKAVNEDIAAMKALATGDTVREVKDIGHGCKCDSYRHRFGENDSLGGEG